MADRPKPEKKPILVLRERMGGVPDKLKEYNKSLLKARKDISAALRTGPKTVPEIARETGMASKDAMWHVMAMRRYGLIVEGNQRGDYFEYCLKEGAR
jgi:hypothetical protein